MEIIQVPRPEREGNKTEQDTEVNIASNNPLKLLLSSKEWTSEQYQRN